jgi:hypothetical protein
MQKLIHVALIMALTGCAATYKPPVSVAPDTSRAISGSQSTLMRAAKQALIASGYQIAAVDDAAGVISVAQRDMRLTPELADCGTTMGLDYLKDNRTSSKVGYGLLITDNKVVITANLSATYLPGNDTQSITMTCVSKGVLENGLLSKIAAIAG